MAERRMFAKTIIDSDAFLDMPLSAQALYFHLSMRADDDGFINNPKKIQRMIGASDDDGKLLLLKRFIIEFESGVVVIKHWKIHNYIQKDRYKPTIYQEEKAMLSEKESKAYTENSDGMTLGIPNGYKMDTQVRLGKDRSELGESKERKKAAKPSFDEILSEITSEELKQTYRDYIEMRKTIKAPMTERALKTLMNKVDSLETSIDGKCALLETAILNNWKSVYAPKGEANKPQNPRNPKAPAKGDAFMDELQSMYNSIIEE